MRPTRAEALHHDAVRRHPLAAWVIVPDQVGYPGHLVARLVTDQLMPYVLLADTLGSLHVQLPLGLVCSERKPSNLLEMVET